MTNTHAQTNRHTHTHEHRHTHTHTRARGHTHTHSTRTLADTRTHPHAPAHTRKHPHTPAHTHTYAASSPSVSKEDRLRLDSLRGRVAASVWSYRAVSRGVLWIHSKLSIPIETLKQLQPNHTSLLHVVPADLSACLHEATLASCLLSLQ